MIDCVVLTAALTPDEVLDLQWFFVNAAGDCGIRSSMGPTLDIARTGFLPQKNCGPGRGEDADSVYRAGERANAIACRMRRLTDRQRISLEAQFSTDTPVGQSGVTLSLASLQPIARWSHREGLDSVNKSRSKAERLRRKESHREHAVSTLRNWLLYLGQAARDDAECVQAKILGQLIGQAREALRDACDAYAATRQRQPATRGDGVRAFYAKEPANDG